MLRFRHDVYLHRVAQTHGRDSNSRLSTQCAYTVPASVDDCTDPPHPGGEAVPDEGAGVLRGGDRQEQEGRLHPEHHRVRGTVLQVLQALQVCYFILFIIVIICQT